MRIIISHLGRWRTLQLSDDPYKVRRILLDEIRAKPALHLENIKVSQSHPYNRPSRLKLQNSSPRWCAENVFMGFPNLKTVEWTNSTSDLSALPTFRNLKSLWIGDDTLHDMSPKPFIHLIRRILLESSSLEKLIIHNHLTYAWRENSDTEAMNLQLPSVSHHSLQTLFVESSDSIRSAAMRSLILPKLRTFSAGYYADSIDLSCCRIIAQENSHPGLRVVSICGNIDNGFEIPETFHPHIPFLRPAIQNLGNLRVLTLREINFDGGRWLPDLGQCCPHLRWLLFVECIGFTVPSIRLLVETRIQKVEMHPLEVLCIQTPHFAPSEYTVSEEDAAWFSEYLSSNRDHYSMDMEPEA